MHRAFDREQKVLFGKKEDVFIWFRFYLVEIYVHLVKIYTKNYEKNDFKIRILYSAEL